MSAAARYIIADMLSLLEHLGYNDNTVTNRARAYLAGESFTGECSASPLPSGKHQVDTSMESGPNNCFFCEKPMPFSHLAHGGAYGWHPGDEA